MRKALNHLCQADPVLARIIEQVGRYRMDYKEATFHGLAQSIVYQQLSGKAASTIFGRLLAAAGNPLKPESVLALSVPELRAFGLSTQKATYVRDLAAKTVSGELQFEKLPRLSDERVMAALIPIKGVGVWTVHMFLMFALRRPNVLPTGDLGIRQAIKKAYKLEQMPAPADIERIALGWHPYCSVASWYLWRSLERKSE